MEPKINQASLSDFIALNDSPVDVGIGAYAQMLSDGIGELNLISLICRRNNADYFHPGKVLNGIFPPKLSGWEINHRIFRRILKKNGIDENLKLHYLSSWFHPRRNEQGMIVTFHDLHTVNGDLTRIYKSDLKFKGWTNIIAISEQTRKDLVNSGYGEDNVTVIHHAISDFWHKETDPSDLGNEIPDISEMNSQNLPVVLTVKDGQNRNNNKTREATFGRYFHIHIGSDIKADLNLSHISRKALRYLYSIADAYVRPADSEGFGNPPVEALMCGTPSVVSDIPTYHETLMETGIYVERNVDGIREGIKEAVENGGKYVENFNSTRRQHFSMSRFRKEMLSYYRERDFYKDT